jgi:hypothetical protein
MIRVLLTAMTLAAAGAVPAVPATPAPPAANAPKPLVAGTFIQDSVLAGLTEDGVAPALAEALAKNNDYVPKCGLCSPMRTALELHGKLKTVPAAREGKGLSEDLVKRLKSDKSETRHAALRELTQRYIMWGYEKFNLTAEQKAVLQREMEEMRKHAMGNLPQGQKYCPSCDGATCRTPKL